MIDKTIAKYEAALQAAYRALETASQDEVPVEEWSIYEGRVAACRADLQKAHARNAPP